MSHGVAAERSVSARPTVQLMHEVRDALATWPTWQAAQECAPGETAMLPAPQAGQTPDRPLRDHRPSMHHSHGVDEFLSWSL